MVLKQNTIKDSVLNSYQYTIEAHKQSHVLKICECRKNIKDELDNKDTIYDRK